MTNLKNSSAKYRLNQVDVYKVLRGLAVTLAGAFLTYVGSLYLDFDYTIEVQGQTYDLTVYAVAIIGAIIEAGRRALENYSTTTAKKKK